MVVLVPRAGIFLFKGVAWRRHVCRFCVDIVRLREYAIYEIVYKELRPYAFIIETSD